MKRRSEAKEGVTPPRSVDEWTVKHLNNDVITMVIVAILSSAKTDYGSGDDGDGNHDHASSQGGDDD